MTRPRRALVGLAAVTALGACSASSTPPGSPASSPAATNTVAGATPSSVTATPVPESFTPGPSDVDLPAPAEPSTPAPSTAGPLSLTSIPVPAGWHAVVTKGGVEQGYLGNGTPAHGRDPRYAAYEVMGVGCAPVSRSAWTDPTAALEVNLAQGSRTGLAEAMVFATQEQAATWFGLFVKQLQACATGTDPHVTGSQPDGTAWVGRRRYASGEQWAEVAAVTASTVRLYVLAGTPREVTDVQQRQLLAQVRAGR